MPEKPNTDGKMVKTAWGAVSEEIANDPVKLKRAEKSANAAVEALNKGVMLEED